MEITIIYVSSNCYIDFIKELVFSNQTRKQLTYSQLKLLKKLCSNPSKVFERDYLTELIWNESIRIRSKSLTDLIYSTRKIDYDLRQCIVTRRNAGVSYVPRLSEEEIEREKHVKTLNNTDTQLVDILNERLELIKEGSGEEIVGLASMEEIKDMLDEISRIISMSKNQKDPVLKEMYNSLINTMFVKVYENMKKLAVGNVLVNSGK